MVHLAKPAFAIAFGQIQQSKSVLLLIIAMSPKELLIEETYGLQGKIN